MAGFEIPSWLEGLPLAPEFRPTDTEFSDPISYISKIEKEAGAFGICKIIPPLPKPSKKFVFWNLNKSLLKSPELGRHVNQSNICSLSQMNSEDDGNEGEFRAVFTTRHQELGQSVKRQKGVVQNPQLGVHQQVWQSGEIYTLEQFESKSKAFAKSVLSGIKDVSPLAIEAMFWKSASEKPIHVEYANDVPGSAFAAPEGKFLNIRRRRRKRNFYQRRSESSELNRNENENPGASVMKTQEELNNISGAAPAGTILEKCQETSKMLTSSSLSSEDNIFCPRQKSSSYSIDMEGTAGWKLSNSKWNLQEIARAPGSLTRFMPDDIPGVTSPMIYIGMLFSWFAWHVEDHELHSMNFLHTGTQKTWYAVPGDYAFAFEEVIRAGVCGGNIDHLAALTLLGEKTTLLSPEVVVSSGIPCCRLVQNPGEFVVTFPRAYHVGFSHGFNCGEAANFGTPQWLTVAKEAAVRRAAMNYLPMLSHQQLLYLLTMSFVLRVPRSLLPGVRSSRLRDRLKEEREFLVKKHFVDDILRENSALSNLFRKESSCRAVLWNPDLLPCFVDPQLPKTIATSAATSSENDVPENHDCEVNIGNITSNLAEEMSLCLETMNDLYFESDDLSCDFQVDSGTLACVACGILGFPFMSVVQPSEKASMELLSNDHLSSQEEAEAPGSKNIDSSTPELGGLMSDPHLVSDVYPPSKDFSGFLITKFEKEWNTSHKLLRPRSFCLEHAVEIVELMQSKGGANVLVICHSDFQKIKAHAMAIADEIGSPLEYKEFSLDTASQEDLKLIEHAIDDGEHNGCGEDWTSKLGINLQYCVKLRKTFPSKQVQHALALDGLFSIRSSGSDFLPMKWQSKRSRSKKLTDLFDGKPTQTNAIKSKVIYRENSDGDVLKKEETFIHYYRRNKLKASNPTVENIVQPHNAGPGDNSTSLSAKMSISTCEMSESQHGMMFERISDVHLCSSPPQVSDSSAMASLVVESTDTGIENHSSNHMCVGSEPSLSGNHISKKQEKIKVNEGDRNNMLSCVVEFSTSPIVAADERLERAITESCCGMDEVCKTVAEVYLNAQDNGVVLVKEAESANSHINDNHVESSEGKIENPLLATSSTSVEVSNEVISNAKTFDEIKTADRIQERGLGLYQFAPVEHLSLTSIQGTCGGRAANYATEIFHNSMHLGRTMEQAIKATDKNNEKVPISSFVGQDNQSISTSVGVCSEVSKGICASSNIDSDKTYVPIEIQVVDMDYHTLAQCLVNQVPNSLEKCAEIPGRLTEDESAENGVPRRLCDKENSSGGMTSEKVEWNALSNTDTNEAVARLDSFPSRPILDSKEEYFESQRVYNAVEDLLNDNDKEVSSSRSDLVNMECEEALPWPADEGAKRKREQITENRFDFCGFVRSPCEGLRSRAARKEITKLSETDENKVIEEKPVTKKRRPCNRPVPSKDVDDKANTKRLHRCDLEGCRMGFSTKAELVLHKRNQCSHEGCRKSFSSHKYVVLHQRVHDDDRPLKCPWKGCSMSFKWAWARTEHIRVHTGERPYHCKVAGCGLSFRFVSDYSRHRRRTGHYVEQPA